MALTIEREELAVITCLFSPNEHSRRTTNFETFRKQFGRSLYIAELAFGERAWLTKAGPNVLQLRGSVRHVMWQKERLLNHLIRSLPRHVTHVAWVDADVMFLDAGWPSHALEKLRQYPVIQLFDTVSHLDADGFPIMQHAGLIASAAERGWSELADKQGASGFAWAARREVLERLPMPDFMILGGADACMAAGYAGIPSLSVLSRVPVKTRRAIESWLQEAKSLIGGRVGYLPGTIEHLFHGALSTRQYLQRYELLRNADFDPAKDIVVDESGLQMWATKKPRLHQQSAAYFEQRAVAENK